MKGKVLVKRSLLVLLVFLTVAALYHGYRADSGDMRESRILRGSLTNINKELEKTGENIYCYRIPQEQEEPLMLGMENYMTSLVVELDGEELCSYEDWNLDRGVRKIWVELPAESGGKVLALRFLSGGDLISTTLNSPVYLGEKTALFYQFIADEGYALLFWGLSVILSIIVFGSAVILRKKAGRKSAQGLVYLGIFILDAGGWVLLDSQILQIFTGRSGVRSVFSFLCLLLLPTWLLLFIREIVIQKKKRFDILCAVTLCVTGLTMGSYLLGICPMYKIITVQHVLIIVTILTILKEGINEVRRYRNKEMRRLLEGFVFLSFFVFLSLYLFYKNPSGNYSVFYCIGFMGFIFCMGDSALTLVVQEWENKTSLAAYRRMAYRDVLTGLENRAAFEEEMEQDELSRKAAYIMLDNNGLKAVNDSLGHQAGDELLTDTAQCLTEVFGRIGRCFRIGGDEFMVIVYDMREKEVCAALEDLKDVISRKNRGRCIPIEVACGYAYREEDGKTARELYEAADQGMYRNKEQRKTAGI